MKQRWRCQKCDAVVQENLLVPPDNHNLIQQVNPDSPKLKAKYHRRWVREFTSGSLKLKQCGPVVTEDINDYIDCLEEFLGEILT